MLIYHQMCFVAITWEQSCKKYPWIKSLRSRALVIRPALLQIMTCDLASAKPLSECWNIVNWTLRNKLQQFIYPNSFSFQENPLQNVVWKMAATMPRPQCVKFVTCSIWLSACPLMVLFRRIKIKCFNLVSGLLAAWGSHTQERREGHIAVVSCPLWEALRVHTHVEYWRLLGDWRQSQNGRVFEEERWNQSWSASHPSWFWSQYVRLPGW